MRCFRLPQLQTPSLVGWMRSYGARGRFWLQSKVFAKRRTFATKSYFPILYANPSLCQGVVVRLTRARMSAGAPPIAYLNGVATSYEVCSKVGSQLFLLFPAEGWEPWENVLAFSLDGFGSLLSIPLALHAYPVADHPESAMLSHEPRAVEALDDSGRVRDAFTMPANIPPSVAVAGGNGDGYEYLTHSYCEYPDSKYYHTFYPCYDYDVAAYRLGSWIWTSSVVISALCARGDLFADKALGCGEALLGFRKDTGDEEGGFFVRWDFTVDSPAGVVPWVAPNDSALLASYGLLSLYDRTGDTRWLEVAIGVGEWILRRGMKPDGTVLVGYREDLKRWVDDWLYVDVGFTGRLFAELYRRTGEAIWLDALQRFTDRFVAMFYRRDGRFYKVRFASGVVDENVFARGQGWALEGLLAADALLPGRYEECVDEVGRYMLSTQRSDGAWNYLINRPATGPCNKGTPVVAYHLLRLAKRRKGGWRQQIRRAAEKALAWCRTHMEERGPLSGAIAARSAEGAIVVARGAKTAFTYGNAWYALAREVLRNEEGE